VAGDANRILTCFKIGEVLAMYDPIVWVLRSNALGGDGEALALAQALPWPYVEKQMVFNSRQGGLKRIWGSRPWGSLANVDTQKSDPLTKPWPDLVLAVGRRQASVARWIKRQSGGKARLVQFQFPVMPVRFFDLVVSDAYPETENVIFSPFPVMRLSQSPHQQDLLYWQDVFRRFPRPWHALFLGGPAKPYLMDENSASEMFQSVIRRVKQEGGSLLVSTSRRTPQRVINLLQANAGDIAHLHIWSDMAQPNPFAAMINLADQVIVTSDSVSMTIEAVRAAKPTVVYDLPTINIGARKWLPSRLLYTSAYQGQKTRATRLADALRRAGMMEMPDHLTVFQARMREDGHTTFFQDNVARPPRPLPDVLPEIVARVKAWFPKT
jgi:uncharacterized protein